MLPPNAKAHIQIGGGVVVTIDVQLNCEYFGKELQYQAIDAMAERLGGSSSLV